MLFEVNSQMFARGYINDGGWKESKSRKGTGAISLFARELVSVAEVSEGAVDLVAATMWAEGIPCTWYYDNTIRVAVPVELREVAVRILGRVSVGEEGMIWVLTD